MAETVNYKCPNCFGPLHYVGSTGQLQCDYCESTFDPQEVERIYAQRQAEADQKAKAEQQSSTADAPQEPKPSKSAAEASKDAASRVRVKRSTATDPVQAYLENSELSEENLRAYNCSSCGAQLMVDQVTAVTSCPYCGNNTVLPGQLSDTLKPDFVIPFKKSKEDAIAALKEYYKGKRYLPNTFTDENHLEEIQGVYVPFWLYSGTAKGDMSFSGTETSTWTDTENLYTNIDHFSLHRAGDLQFSRVPVDGSSRMPDTHMDAIEPFDYGELTPFSVAYLPGYVTDRYDLDVTECKPRADTRAEASLEDAMRQTTQQFEGVTLEESKVSVTWSEISYALLPVWMLHTKWQDKDYLFAMNGQTGRLIGDLPVDNGKATKNFLLIFGIGLVIMAVVVILFLDGFVA